LISSVALRVVAWSPACCVAKKAALRGSASPLVSAVNTLRA